MINFWEKLNKISIKVLEKFYIMYFIKWSLKLDVFWAKSDLRQSDFFFGTEEVINFVGILFRLDDGSSIIFLRMLNLTQPEGFVSGFSRTTPNYGRMRLLGNAFNVRPKQFLYLTNTVSTCTSKYFTKQSTVYFSNFLSLQDLALLHKTYFEVIISLNKYLLFFRFGRLNQIKALAPYVPLGGKAGKEQVKT